MRLVPWVEKFRPRSLSEVILTRNQRNQVLNWWRTWVILWNLRVIWSQKYGQQWMEFYGTKQGRSFWKKHRKSWYEHFQAEFSRWGASSEIYSKIFEPNTIADVKPTTKPLFEKFLETVWSKYVFKYKITEQDIPIPPFPAYKPLLLVGPPGTGKTTTAYALANDEGVFVIEFNASDERSKTSVTTIIREASKSTGFYMYRGFPQKPPRILLLDEIDGMSAQRDKGGFTALLVLLEDIKIPPILTANVIHDPKIRQLMARCITVFFDRPHEYQVKQLIKRIASIVKMDVPEEIVQYLIKYAPDFRSIVVALETYYYTRRLPSLWHEKMTSLQDAIRFAFGIKSKEGFEASINLAKRYLQESGEDIVDLMLTAWDNAWNFIRKDNIFGFYKAVADADYYYKIGARKGNWRVAYLNSTNLLAYAMAKYGEPGNIWSLRRKRVNIPKMGTIFMGLYQILRGETPLGKLVFALAEHWHISRRRTLRELTILAQIASYAPEKIGQLFAQLSVPEDAIDAFVSRFGLSSKVKRKIKGAYKDTVKHLGLKALKEDELGIILQPKKVESEVEKKETIKVEKKKKVKEKRKKQKTGTLDMFLK